MDMTHTLWPGKNAPQNTTYMGRRAEHDMNGMASMVTTRVKRFSMVRVAITAGTLHPNPISSGMNDLPCSPMRDSRGSASMVARAR